MARWSPAQLPDLSGKVAIVTGANSGLGLETAAGLAARGATVVMACRDPARAASALDAVRQRAPAGRAETMALDLADLAAIRAFATAFIARHPRLDILCNNAGVMHLPYRKTRDGFEMQIGTNHLGHFALTGLLLERLATTPGARVVHVASIAHRFTRGIDLDDLNWERKPYNKADAYAKSKLANLLFHYELQRRLSRHGLSAISVAAHPGFSATNIGFGDRDGTPLLQQLAMRLANVLIAQPADMGALPTLYAAGDPRVKAGDYIGPDGWFMQFRGYPTVVDARPAAHDAATAGALWALSEKLTGVRYL